MFVRILQGDIPRHNPLLLRSLGHLNEVECRFPFFIMTASCQNPPSFQFVAARFRFNKCESSPSLGLWFVFFINSISGRMINHHYSGCSRKINAGLANDVLSQFTMTMILKSPILGQRDLLGDDFSERDNGKFNQCILELFEIQISRQAPSNKFEHGKKGEGLKSLKRWSIPYKRVLWISFPCKLYNLLCRN